MRSDIFIFVKILKFLFLQKFWILWQNYGKIQSLGPKFSQNFPWNTDETFGAATLILLFQLCAVTQGCLLLVDGPHKYLYYLFIDHFIMFNAGMSTPSSYLDRCSCIFCLSPPFLLRDLRPLCHRFANSESSEASGIIKPSLRVKLNRSQAVNV